MTINEKLNRHLVTVQEEIEYNDRNIRTPDSLGTLALNLRQAARMAEMLRAQLIEAGK